MDISIFKIFLIREINEVSNIIKIKIHAFSINSFEKFKMDPEKINSIQ